MSSPDTDLDGPRGYEKRILFLAGAAAIAGMAIIELATAPSPVAPWRLAIYFLLNLALLGRYPFWSRVPFYAPFWADLRWPLLGLALTALIALQLGGHATLYFYLSAFEGCMIFPRRWWRAAWTVLVLWLATALSLMFYPWEPVSQSLLRDLPVYTLLVVVADLLYHQEEGRIRAEKLLRKVEEAHGRLQEHTSQAEALAVAAERARLAREVHDTLGHTLTALDVQMELLARLPDSQAEARRQAAQRARTLVKEGLADLRRAVYALGPGALEAFALPEAVGSLVNEFRERSGTDATWRVEGEPFSVPARLGLPLYRAVQEALTNVSRHAAAERVSVTLRFSQSGVGVAVEDDGRGAQAPFGRGLQGLQQRADALGGTFRAGPRPERGFRMEMALPR